MTNATLDRDFQEQTTPFRRELMAHCYRMLGSVHDAEDLVQETYLRAWRSFENFEGRSSLRTWLHRIANNACLTALESKNRRALPTDLSDTSTHPDDPLVRQPEVAWLEPIPDAAVNVPTDPAEVIESRHSTRLALIAVMQQLPPKQRAVLVLRDVLRWSAAEVAEHLGSTTASVNSALQRAHAQMAKVGLSEDDVNEPTTREQREVLNSYVTAFEDKNISALVDLFTDNAVWEMPPFPGWYQGREHLRRLIDVRCPGGPGDMRLRATAANGQPAFGLYMRGDDRAFYPFHLQVLALNGARIEHVAAFFDTDLFRIFELPDSLPAEA